MKIMSLTVKYANVAEVQEARRIQTELTVKTSFGIRIPPDSELKRHDFRFAVAKDNNHIVGYAVMYKAKKNQITIRAFGLLPEYRGKHGSSFLRRIENLGAKSFNRDRFLLVPSGLQFKREGISSYSPDKVRERWFALQGYTKLPSDPYQLVKQRKVTKKPR